MDAVGLVRAIGNIVRNKDGASKKFHDLAEELAAATQGYDVGFLEVLRVMRLQFRAKTAGSWKPYAALLLRFLVSEDAAEQDRILWKVTPEELVQAQELAGGAAEHRKIRTGFSVIPKADRGSGVNTDALAIPKVKKNKSCIAKVQDAPKPAAVALEAAPPQTAQQATSSAASTAPGPSAVWPRPLGAQPLAPRRGQKRAAEAHSSTSQPPLAGQTSLRSFMGFSSSLEVAELPQTAEYARNEATTFAPAEVNDEQRRWLDLLGLPHTATLTLMDIKTQFRQRALALHPDKGGTAEAFREVFEAYCALLDNKDKLAAGGGGSAEAAGGSEATTEELALAAAQIVARFGADVKMYLASLSSSAVEALLQLMKDSMLDSSKGAESEAAGREEKSHAGFYRCGGGLWQAKIAWRRWVIKSARVPEQRAWHIYCTMLEVRSAALRRHAELKESMQLIGRPTPEAEIDRDYAPISDEELARLRKAAPLAPFFFSSDFGRTCHNDTKRVQSYFTPSCQSALKFRIMVRSTLGTGKQAPARLDQIEKLRVLIRQQVDADHAANDAQQAHLLLVVEAEVARRRTLQTAALPSTGSQALAIADMRDDVHGCIGQLRDEVREAKEETARKMEEMCREMRHDFEESSRRQIALLEQQVEELRAVSHKEEYENELISKDRQLQVLARQLDATRMQQKPSSAKFVPTELHACYMANIHQDGTRRLQREQSNSNFSRREAAWQTAKE